MRKEQAHNRGYELERQGWKFFVLGKKPFHIYSAEKDGITIKGSSSTKLVENIDKWISLNEKPKTSLESETFR